MNHLQNFLDRQNRKGASYGVDYNISTRSFPETDKKIHSEFVLNKLGPFISFHPYPLDKLRLVSSTIAFFNNRNESGYHCGPFEAISRFTSQCHLPFRTTILGLPGMGLTYWL